MMVKFSLLKVSALRDCHFFSECASFPILGPRGRQSRHPQPSMIFCSGFTCDSYGTSKDRCQSLPPRPAPKLGDRLALNSSNRICSSAGRVHDDRLLEKIWPLRKTPSRNTIALPNKSQFGGQEDYNLRTEGCA